MPTAINTEDLLHRINSARVGQVIPCTKEEIQYLQAKVGSNTVDIDVLANDCFNSNFINKTASVDSLKLDIIAELAKDKLKDDDITLLLNAFLVLVIRHNHTPSRLLQTFLSKHKG